MKVVQAITDIFKEIFPDIEIAKIIDYREDNKYIVTVDTDSLTAPYSIDMSLNPNSVGVFLPTNDPKGKFKLLDSSRVIFSKGKKDDVSKTITI